MGGLSRGNESGHTSTRRRVTHVRAFGRDVHGFRGAGHGFGVPGAEKGQALLAARLVFSHDVAGRFAFTLGPRGVRPRRPRPAVWAEGTSRTCVGLRHAGFGGQPAPPMLVGTAGPARPRSASSRRSTSRRRTSLCGRSARRRGGLGSKAGHRASARGGPLLEAVRGNAAASRAALAAFPGGLDRGPQIVVVDGLVAEVRRRRAWRARTTTLRATPSGSADRSPSAARVAARGGARSDRGAAACFVTMRP
jgi:hypothetical protein